MKVKINISLDKAKPHNLFYFVVTGTIYHPKLKKCLILQRSRYEVAHAGLWGVTGGKLSHQDFLDNPPTRKNHEIWDWYDIIEKLLIREAKEESGLEVYQPKILNAGTGFVRPDGVPVVMFKYGLKYKSGKVKIEEESFEDWAWVDEKEVKQYDIIDEIDNDVASTIKAYTK